MEDVFTITNEIDGLISKLHSCINNNRFYDVQIGVYNSDDTDLGYPDKLYYDEMSTPKAPLDCYIAIRPSGVKVYTTFGRPEMFAWKGISLKQKGD